MDAKGKWAGGKAHLVQTGDLLDRGKDTRKVLVLLMRLEGDARKAGGRVHALLGNHEVMNLLGDRRYLNAEEHASFRTPDSEAYREAFLKSASERAREAARAAGEAFDEAAFRSKFLEEVPLGLVERTQALAPQGRSPREGTIHGAENAAIAICAVDEFSLANVSIASPRLRGEGEERSSSGEGQFGNF